MNEKQIFANNISFFHFITCHGLWQIVNRFFKQTSLNNRVAFNRIYHFLKLKLRYTLKLFIYIYIIYYKILKKKKIKKWKISWNGTASVKYIHIINKYIIYHAYLTNTYLYIVIVLYIIITYICTSSIFIDKGVIIFR